MSDKNGLELNDGSGRVYTVRGPLDRVRSSSCCPTSCNKSFLSTVGCVILILTSIILSCVYYFGSSGNSCLTVGIPSGHCAILFDEEHCDTSDTYLKVKDGDEGRLTSAWSIFSSKLKRNDLESLIVAPHCKLELWDDDDGIENGASPDLILDNTYFQNAKYINSFRDISTIKHLDESISAFRCNCKKPDMTLKFWEAEKPKRRLSAGEIFLLFKKQDTNEDTYLVKQELLDFGISKSTTDLVFLTSDIDGDGQISYIEYLILMEGVNV